MNNENRFKSVARHSAVQALLGTCYAENLRIVSAVLARQRQECACLQKGGKASPITRLPLEGEEMRQLAMNCSGCRKAIENAASAWESGDLNALRGHLKAYREAHAHVRKSLMQLAH